MAQCTSLVDSPRIRSGLLRDQVQLVKRKDSDRYEIVPIQDALSFGKGFFLVIRTCQLLPQKNEGILFVGVAGPSGSGKTVFTEKLLNFMPSIAVITMDHYNNASRIIDGNFDDPRLTDYDTLLQNIHGWKEGKAVQVPIYDFKSSSCTGYRTIEVPSSRIVLIEGIYALSERLRPLLDLHVSITGGVHFDLVKRVLRDVQRAGQEPEEIIQQISETVYPMYNAFIEPDLHTAHIRIINNFNPFSGFQNPTYILKSTRIVTEEQIKAVLSEDYKETKEETYDIYLLPPGEDPEACQSYLRMRNRDGKYNLMFEEWVTDNPSIISPRITFQVTVRLLGGLMALGYTISAILKRNSHVFSDSKVCLKTDWLEQLNRTYFQVQGRDRLYVKYIAEQLDLDGSYISCTYIEQIQLEKLVNDVMALPDDLKTKLRIDDNSVSSPKEALSQVSADKRMKHLTHSLSHSHSTQRRANVSKLSKLEVKNRSYHGRIQDSPASLASQGTVNQLSEQISTLSERTNDFTSCIEELNSKFSNSSQPNSALQSKACNGYQRSLSVSGLNSGPMANSAIPRSSSSSQLTKESMLMEEIIYIARGQGQIMQQLDNLSNLLREKRARPSLATTNNGSRGIGFESVGVSLVLALALGGLGVFLYRSSHK